MNTIRKGGDQPLKNWVIRYLKAAFKYADVVGDLDVETKRDLKKRYGIDL